MTFRLVLSLAVVIALCGDVQAAPQAAGGDNQAVNPPETETGVSPDDNEAPNDAGVDWTQQPDEVDLEELQRRLDILAAEVERLRSGDAPAVDLTQGDPRALGLAPSAAATYERDRGVSFAGYGEMLYEGFSATDEAGQPSGRGAQFDFLRAIIYTGYRFSDRFLFNSEIEIEHSDEIFVEFAYIDWLATEHLGVRGGLLLLPMGLVNEFHEPTVFLGSARPVTEQRIIPSTWRENGGGVHGSAGRFAYRAYLVNGLDAMGFSATGIRRGRQKGSKAKASSLAFVGRLDVTPTPGFFVGASLYTGGSGQAEILIDDQRFDVRTTIVDLHGQAQLRGFDVRGLFAAAHIGDAAELNHVLGLTDQTGVAEWMRGGYLQFGYDLMSQLASTGGALTPYYRWERVDTQASMPIGFERALTTDNTFNTLGLELKPIPNIVVKIDHGWASNAAETGVNQFNLSLGYAF